MPAFYSTIPKADVTKTEILPGRGKDDGSKRSGKAKEKRNGTIGLMGGFTRPKARMISGFSLKTYAIYGRIYFGILYKKMSKSYKRYERRRARGDKTDFNALVDQVQHVHDVTSSYAKGAVNQLLTARNWAIGYYIVEYEQRGKERAEYGDNLLEKLAKRIDCKGLDRSMLNLCRTFYLKYPQICDSANHRLKNIGAIGTSLQLLEDKETEVEGSICDSVNHKFKMDPEMLITRLSFTHIRQLLPIDDPFERFFYELECIKGTWSVRELRRQITTNLYFRAGISKKPEQLLDVLADLNRP